MKTILICNGALGGADGNTATIIELLQKNIQSKNYVCEVVTLKNLLDQTLSFSDLKKKLESASGFIFTSGTYWDSWGSPMQNFLELATELETSSAFLGKPVSVVITMHSVGGKGVLSRLQGVLNTLGMMIPPMSGMVYSLAGHLALQTESTFSDDFWSLEDTDTIVHNLTTCLEGQKNFKTWPVDHEDPKRIWIK